MIPFKHSRTGDCEHACCLRVEDLCVQAGGSPILSHIDLHMHCGQLVALIGPNGAGKSTLIQSILGQREYSGKITFHDSHGRQTKLRIGYVPQSPRFSPGDPISVLDLFTCCISRRPAFLRPTRAQREKVLARRSSTSASARSPAASFSACCWRWRLSPCRICSFWTSRFRAWTWRA